MAMASRFFLDDCRALHAKALLPARQLQDWEQRFPGDAAVVADEQVRTEFRMLVARELDDLIDGIRVKQNDSHKDKLQQSDLMAVAAGGVLGALNAWWSTPSTASSASSTAATIPTTTTTTTTTTPSLWASAFDAAQASLNVVRQRRLLEHLRIVHVSGDEMSADHVMLCINGFMTQGSDALHNWQPWLGTASSPSSAPSSDQQMGTDDNHNNHNVVLYALQWEAGDADAWNAFCSHAQDNLRASTTSTQDLLTHFTQNPWHRAQDKATQVGILLARVLAARPTFTRARRVTLLGHSLGGAVIHSALTELVRMRSDPSRTGNSDTLVHSAVLFAGAFHPPRASELRAIARELSPHGGRLINVFSTRDDVLGKLFWALHMGMIGGSSSDDSIGTSASASGSAVGCVELGFQHAGIINGVNVDVTDLVVPTVANQFGHSYGPHMAAIRKRVLPHLAGPCG